MKIRIKGNSVRLRLSRSEVAKLDKTGYLEEQTLFIENKFIYALKAIDEGNELSVTFANNKITVLIPKFLIEDWPENNRVGFEAKMKLTEADSLYLLVEKDFICVDETTEDQSDNYQNPNKTC
ncbi:MAG: hypothetical protein ABI402_15825 [Ferruginibacter sp.]